MSADASPRLLIVGATSAIATEVARRYAARGARIFLLARRKAALQAIAADLGVRGGREVQYALLDANDIARHAEVIERAWRHWDGFDATLIAHGVLPDQASAQMSVEETLSTFDTNARSVIALLTVLANRFEAQGAGVIAVLSSPAGNRGRASNYVYGAAKAAVTAFASGTRHRLHVKGVRVVTILPGFVDTPMTATFPKGPLWASPGRIADDIFRALQRGTGTLYTPWFWRWIMLVVTHLPEWLFVRTKL
jgi:decaprenylphospho-beta-D-erythro-pentofuranosid-2-ulose 2-reductase